jgi:hypothetical protein
MQNEQVTHYEQVLQFMHYEQVIHDAQVIQVEQLTGKQFT